MTLLKAFAPLIVCTSWKGQSAISGTLLLHPDRSLLKLNFFCMTKLMFKVKHVLKSQIVLFLLLTICARLSPICFLSYYWFA